MSEESMLYQKIKALEKEIERLKTTASKKAEWKFCPECGCREYIQKDMLGPGSRTCKECHQEWWTDIDYYSPSIKVIDELQAIRSKMDKAQTRTMHKDKYGNLSVYVGHDLEGSETVEVLLMEVEESNE